MHSSSIALLANWSAFSIAERVLAFKDKLQQLPLPSPQSNQPNQPSATKRFEDSLYRHVVQVAVSTDSGSISIKSINLQHVSRADGLKLSLVGTSQANESGYGPCATALVNADTAVTELFSKSARLWRTHLTSPSIYADHVRPMDLDIPPSTYIAVGYKVLEMGLLEQVPGLLQIADEVILDEVAKVMALIKSTTSEVLEEVETKAIAVQPTTSRAKPSVKIHMALLAGDLRLEVSLLQSVTYQLSGTAASFRLAPSLKKERAWAIDFDVGRQGHCFINSTLSKRHEQSIVDVPPINGHVGLELKPEATSLSVAASMDKIEVNAAAIQGVVSTINQPEIQNVMSSIKAGVDDVKGHVMKVFPPSTLPAEYSPQSSGDSKQLAFEVRFALLGVRVAAITPRGKGKTSEIEFGIGPLHAIASNRKILGSSKMLLPEVRAQIRDIGARLQMHEGKQTEPCGHATFGIDIHFKSQIDANNKLARTLRVQSHGLEVHAYPDTASTAVEMINQMQKKLKAFDLSKEKDYLRGLHASRRGSVIQKISGKEIALENGEPAFSAVDLLSVSTTVRLDNIKAFWIVDQSYASHKNARISDLVLSLERIEFTTRGGREARLAIEDLQLSLVKKNAVVMKRSLNSALLPEVTFSVGYWLAESGRNLTFKAAGKPLELRLESKFIVPVNALSKSINSAIEKFRAGTATWQAAKATATTSEMPITALLDPKRLNSVLFEADFAGALFYVQGSGPRDQSLATLAASQQQQQHGTQHGRYGQFAAEGAEMQTMLKAPGIAIKVEYNASKSDQSATLNGEIMVEASSNMVLPNVVPLLLEISHSVRDIMRAQQAQQAAAPVPTPEPAPTSSSKPVQKLLEDDSIVVADPAVLFGKMKVDVGFRVCRQEFGLTCQPIARVDAKAELDDFYFTINTIESDDHGHFFAITAVITKLGAQVKHVYSREPTITFDMDSIVLSVMNSKHLSGEAGISAILKIQPTKAFINGKQLQDLLLFREIWIPPEIRQAAAMAQASQPANRQDEFFMQRYRAAAAAAAFPWNATVSITQLAIDLDLGQSIGKPSFSITNLWASQTKTSNSEQNLCIGMDEMAMSSTGRMSGFIRLTKLAVRTSIRWPEESASGQKTPLIQGSVGFGRLLTKAAFDYQALAFGDIEGFDFLMYNVHQSHSSARDRLVAVLDCEKAYVFCTATSPARAVGLYQAFDRLIQEKQNAFQQALKDIERHVRRESTIVPTRFGPTIPDSPIRERSELKGTISLHTDVVLTVGTICFGVYPGTFFDGQILKGEANTIQARFAVGLERGKIASALGMTLGQLQVALASVKRANAVPKALDISVDEVVSSATNAKGGTILRVPKVVASMQTWQAPKSNSVDYIFKSLFDGKIDVGWNLSRIDFIKGMWTAHSRSLASRLGKALPESAVKITAGPVKDDSAAEEKDPAKAQGKITAEVHLPQFRYDYHALEPAIIETPQLRDMGEATPPLEWIGLHRDRLPNVTHQIVIVPLLEVAKEVEDAYRSILGSS